MGEFQYYEFQTIDRPLTTEEMTAVGKLSSHIEVSSSRAVVTYQWGDFKHDPKQVVARYFDAMLYMAEWGSRRLILRFPYEMVAFEPMDNYGVEDQVDLETIEDQVLLDIRIDEEGGGWVETAGVLSALAPLRDDILRGDYRALYLAWLAALGTDREVIIEDDAEPPVPAGLRALSPALRALARFLMIDPHLLHAAASASPALHETSMDDWRQAIAALPRDRFEDYLLRLAQGEAHLAIALRRELGLTIRAPTPQDAPRRLAGQLLQMAERARERERRKEEAVAERRRVAALEALAQGAPRLWQRVEELLSIKPTTARAYDEAVGILLQLRELAVHQQQEAPFRERVAELAARYRSRSSFQERLRRAALV